MDKQTFYSELSEKLLALGLSSEYIERHLSQFDGYFNGKSDIEVEAEIARLGDLDRVAARIKRMTEKAINEAKEENEAKSRAEAEAQIVNRETDDALPVDTHTSVSNSTVNSSESSDDNTPSLDDDVVVFGQATGSDNGESTDDSVQNLVENGSSEEHGTKRGSVTLVENKQVSVTAANIDPEQIEKNRKKFWILFAITLPITLAVIAATAAGFALTFFAIAVVILIAIGGLVFITAAGTLVSVFGLIFGVSQMLASVPIGLYECGVAIMIGAVAIFLGILVYNFAVRLMPYAAKWLLVFLRYVARKYRELYVYLKKECIGL